MDDQHAHRVGFAVETLLGGASNELSQQGGGDGAHALIGLSTVRSRVDERVGGGEQLIDGCVLGSERRLGDQDDAAEVFVKFTGNSLVFA